MASGGSGRPPPPPPPPGALLPPPSLMTHPALMMSAAPQSKIVMSSSAITLPPAAVEESAPLAFAGRGAVQIGVTGLPSGGASPSGSVSPGGDNGGATSDITGAPSASKPAHIPLPSERDTMAKVCRDLLAYESDDPKLKELQKRAHKLLFKQPRDKRNEPKLPKEEVRFHPATPVTYTSVISHPLCSKYTAGGCSSVNHEHKPES